jgi:hypothetical protein
VLFWSPRVLSILFTAFVSVFALDVFGEGHGFWQTCLALLMHLVPSALLLAALLVAWRHQCVGAILFELAVRPSHRRVAPAGRVSAGEAARAAERDARRAGRVLD